MRTGVNTHPGTVKYILENYTWNDVISAFIYYNEGEDFDAREFVIDNPIDEIIEELIDKCEYRDDEVIDVIEKYRAGY